MERFEDRAWLDWWANSVTNLGAEVTVAIQDTDQGWDASGELVDDADLEGFNILCNLDPFFDLRFADGSTISVTVHRDGIGGRFTLTEAE